MANYRTGDEIVYRVDSGARRFVRVTNIESAKSGFDGIVIEGSEVGSLVSGYNYQIERVFPATN